VCAPHGITSSSFFSCLSSDSSSSRILLFARRHANSPPSARCRRVHELEYWRRVGKRPEGAALLSTTRKRTYSKRIFRDRREKSKTEVANFSIQRPLHWRPEQRIQPAHCPDAVRGAGEGGEPLKCVNHKRPSEHLISSSRISSCWTSHLRAFNGGFPPFNQPPCKLQVEHVAQRKLPPATLGQHGHEAVLKCIAYSNEGRSGLTARPFRVLIGSCDGATSGTQQSRDDFHFSFRLLCLRPEREAEGRVLTSGMRRYGTSSII
jgi:hypothetical protein